jgi:hypothetical protein
MFSTPRAIWRNAVIRRLLIPSAALLLALAASAPASDPSALVERLGGLPAELTRAKKTDGECVDSLFLATLARLPSGQEKETATKHIAAARDRAGAGRDLAWALVNTKEFLKLHGLDKDAAESLRFLNRVSETWEKKGAK